jgi:hypothetical protein
MRSFVCVMRYISRLKASAAKASATLADRLGVHEDAGLLPDSGE